jgi:uncharacterized membrane protein
MLANLIVYVHVLTVFWLIAGIVGRDVAHRHAARTSELGRLRALIDLGGLMERGMVRPATLAVLLAGLAAAWVRGWPILGFLQGGNVNWVLASLLLYLSIIPMIVLVFVPRGKVFRAALDEASALGQVTPRLTAALKDPAVEAARAYELVVVATLTWLMVSKPF